MFAHVRWSYISQHDFASDFPAISLLLLILFYIFVKVFFFFFSHFGSMQMQSMKYIYSTRKEMMKGKRNKEEESEE